MSKVVAFDEAGTIKAGWPVALPVGYGPFSGATGIPLAPAAGDDGTIYVAATHSDWSGFVLAFDPSGNPRPGWPYALPQALGDFDGGGFRGEYPSNPGPMFVRSPSGGGVLYLALDGELVALGRDGQVASGWPYLLPGSDQGNAYWEAWQATPDGGLVATYRAANGYDSTGYEYTMVRLTPAGGLAH